MYTKKRCGEHNKTFRGLRIRVSQLFLNARFFDEKNPVETCAPLLNSYPAIDAYMRKKNRRVQ